MPDGSGTDRLRRGPQRKGLRPTRQALWTLMEGSPTGRSNRHGFVRDRLVKLLLVVGLIMPKGHPRQSPFVSLRANLGSSRCYARTCRFTPDSPSFPIRLALSPAAGLAALPLRRGSEASSHCRASSGIW